MKLCIWDSETTGLPRFDLPADDPKQPYMCEVAAILVDDQSHGEIDRYEALVTPDGWELSPELTKIHGITTEMCRADGRPIADVLRALHGMMAEADVVLSYGFRFDDKMRRGACRRIGISDLFGTFKWACIQPSVSAACGMPATTAMIKAGRGAQRKTPKLSEAVQILLGESHEGAHRALADARAAARVLFAAHKKGFPMTIRDPSTEERISKAPAPTTATAPLRAPADDLGVI